eukprot:3236814-Rhodomonas_salina.1
MRCGCSRAVRCALGGELLGARYREGQGGKGGKRWQGRDEREGRRGREWRQTDRQTGKEGEG